jgi:diguanylate cyclase (GGDEF)-like protein
MNGDNEKEPGQTPSSTRLTVVKPGAVGDDRAQPPPPASLETYAMARAERRRGDDDAPPALSRSAMAVARARAAARRDEAAYRRDMAARARDQAAAARDRAGERQAEALLSANVRPERAVRTLLDRLAGLRARGAQERAEAAADRARAAVDRAQAALDRRHGRVDVARAHLDDLTGVFRRGMGLETIEMEIERAHRMNEPLVLAFVDVDGLKAVNDSGGHAAGDALLRGVAAAIESQMRTYDPIVRVGGDEFVCVFPNTTLSAASERVAGMHAALAERRPGDSISVGLAILGPQETLEDLIAQGDAAAYRVKRDRGGAAGDPVS